MSASVDRADVEHARGLIAQRMGMWVDDARLDQLAAVLGERIGDACSGDAAAYLQQLAKGPASGELRAVAERITVNESYFFRDWDSFRAFREVVLPDYVRRRRGRGHLRILSAGCAAGEEAHSAAIFIRDNLPDLAAWDITVLGIDINPAVLARARQGRYSPWALRQTPADLRARYFRTEGRDLLLDERIRSMVSFEERNLVDDDRSFWWRAAFDVIFCRNVTMYFTPEATRAVIARLAAGLVPGGYLFLGYAENLRGVSPDFHLRHTHETFYYQLREPGEPRLAWEESPALEVTEPAASWVDLIQNASRRIEALARAPEPGAPAAAAPAATAPITTQQRSWNLSLVMELLRGERFAEALAFLRALPPEATADPDAQLLRAVLLTNLGELSEAEIACGQLLALDELNAGAHYLMALCREHAGDSRAAVEHDQTAIYLNPEFAMPHLHAGLLARRADDPASARRELTQASVLLAREDAARILLFGGGFNRENLLQICRAELRACGGLP